MSQRSDKLPTRPLPVPEADQVLSKARMSQRSDKLPTRPLPVPEADQVLSKAFERSVSLSEAPSLPPRNRRVQRSGSDVNSNTKEFESSVSLSEAPSLPPRNRRVQRSGSDVNSNTKEEELHDHYLVPTEDLLEKYAWFFKGKPEEIPQKLRENGAFLVRPRRSADRQTPYALSVLWKDRVRHIPIKFTDYGYALGSGLKVFPGIEQLVRYYQKNRIFLSEPSEDSFYLLGSPPCDPSAVNDQDLSYEEIDESVTPENVEMAPAPERRPVVRPRVTPFPPQPDPIEKETWYFDIDRGVADMILKSDGQFLVRRSKTGGSTSLYVLCVFYCLRVYHLQIQQRNGEYTLGPPRDGKKTFRTVNELIDYHRENPISLAGRTHMSVLLVDNPPRDGIYDSAE